MLFSEEFSIFFIPMHMIMQQGAAVSSKAQSTSGSGSSRFGWLVQKTIGLVSKSHRQVLVSTLSTMFCCCLCFWFSAVTWLPSWYSEGKARGTEQVLLWREAEAVGWRRCWDPCRGAPTSPTSNKSAIPEQRSRSQLQCSSHWWRLFLKSSRA